MTVSIIVPVYNVSLYVERCIKSVMQQTYSEDVECIIVNDATPDDSIEKCRELIASYKGAIHFRIAEHKFNRGLSASRNTGTELAKGDYILYLDSDDELTPKSIELLLGKAKRHPKCDYIQGAVECIPYKSYYEIDDYVPRPYVASNEWIRTNFYCNRKNLPVNSWNKLLKASFLRENSLTFLEGLIHEDELWMIMLVQKAQSIAFVFEPTYVHYIREGSIMTTLQDNVDREHWYRIIKEQSMCYSGVCMDLQVCKYLYKYFSLGLNLLYGGEKDGIYEGAISVFCKEKMYKGVFFMFCWRHLQWFRKGWRFNSWLMDYIGSEWDKRSKSKIHAYDVEFIK